VMEQTSGMGFVLVLKKGQGDDRLRRSKSKESAGEPPKQENPQHEPRAAQ
jgi:hypothetical protein